MFESIFQFSLNNNERTALTLYVTPSFVHLFWSTSTAQQYQPMLVGGKGVKEPTIFNQMS